MHPHIGLALLAVASLSLPSQSLQAVAPAPSEAPEVCKLSWVGSADRKKETWKKSGAGKFLDNFLKNNGIKDWSEKFFAQTTNNGHDAGSRFDCSIIDSTQCGPADPCGSYQPEEAYFVHQSISTLYSQLNQMLGKVLQESIKGLGSEIKTVIKIFGPGEDKSYMYQLWGGILSVVGGLYGIAGVPVVPSVFTVGVGLINIAAAMDKKNQKTKDDYNWESEESLGHFVSDFLEDIKTVIAGIFAGHVDGFKIKDPVKWITDSFADGALLDASDADDETEKWKENVQKLMVRVMKWKKKKKRS